MITLSGVTKAHGLRTLFEDVSLQVVEGRRIALVGANGAGKTTLLEVLAGEQRADSGQVARAKDVRVGYLRQDVAETRGRSVLAEVLAAAGDVTDLERRMRTIEDEVARMPPGAAQDGLLAEYGRAQDRFEHLGGYGIEAEARRVLAGLGFAEDEVTRDVGAMSGGWMMRVALARLLLSAPDVLLLDEPTNHLDLASVQWLESFLQEYPGAIVMVSHDRDFINALCNRVVEIAGGTATEFVGDYADFVTARELRTQQQLAAARNQQRKIAQTERFIERFRYKASKASQVQSRVKALEKLDRVEAPRERTKRMAVRFPSPPRCGRQVIRLAGIGKRYGDTVVYDGLDFVLERGQKVALVGPNGAGKSTLLKILGGVLPVDGGERVLGHNVTVGYFTQHAVEALDADKTVLQEMTGAVDTAKVNPRSMLGAFLFSGDDVDKRVGVLSGGEKSRLALAKLLANPVNVLCMDEPTNHLDIASRDVLEDALADFEGTLVLITHDRHLIRSVADTIVEVGNRRATVYPGDFEYYLAKTGAEEPAAPAPASGRVESEPDDAERKRAEAERRNRVYRETKGLRRRLERVESDLGAAEAEAAELTRTLADPDVYADPERVKDLVARHNAAKDRAATLTAEWEELYEAVERATAQVTA